MTVAPGATLPYGAQGLALPPCPFNLDPVLPPAPVGRARVPEALAAALRRPLASPGLQEVLHGVRRLLIVVSDGTRATGSAEFLPVLIREIRQASSAEIAFIVAGGIHRPATDQEVEKILGEELAGQFPVLRHDADDDRRLVDLGSTRGGTPVRVNAALVEHDRVVVTGAVGFHYYAGFSGGRKSLVPGLAARQTVFESHLRALRRDGTRHSSARAGNLHNNPVHREMVSAATQIAPHLLVNSVVADDGRVERLFVGHWRRAHEAACRYVRARRSVRLERRDVVVASAGGAPTDLDLIQSHKAFEAGVAGLKPGGVFILAASCREGAGHRDFLPWFDMGDERKVARRLMEDFRVYGQTALSWIRKAREHRLILVSDLEPALARKLGAEPAADLGEAYRLALEHVRHGASGWLLPHASKLLVLPQR